MYAAGETGAQSVGPILLVLCPVLLLPPPLPLPIARPDLPAAPTPLPIYTGGVRTKASSPGRPHARHIPESSASFGLTSL